MRRYNIYYQTKEKRIEQRNVSKDEIDNFLEQLIMKDEHLLRIEQVKEREEEER